MNGKEQIIQRFIELSKGTERRAGQNRGNEAKESR